MAKKMACELKPGDKLESESGVFLVVRAHTMGATTSIIGTVGGALTDWAHYDAHAEFETVTVH